MGYILATGERPYVLVDRFGNMNALAKLIDDKAVRVKHLREFLGKDYPTDSLPTVDEARALAAAHRAAMELFRRGEERASREAVEKERREDLQRRQQPRRRDVEQEAKTLAARQRYAGQEFSQRQKQERMAFRQSYLQESRRVKLDRAAHRPTGLAAFIGRVTGVDLITKKIHQYRDAARYKLFLTQKEELAERQQRDAAALDRRQQLEALTMQRRLHALDLVEKRELRSLETTLLKERRIEDRERTGRTPSPPEPVLTPDETPEKPIDVTAEFGKASAEPEPSHVDEFNRAAKEPIDLTVEFERVSGSGDGGGEASGDAAQDPAPEAEIKIERRRRRTKDRVPDAERPTRETRSDRDKDSDGPPSDDPGPTRGRRRDRDLDRGR
jgi:hypothetical protein